MEYIEGEVLAKLLDKSNEPFSEELVLKWGTQLATVLYFLHIQKPPIIYRDLKPSNIIVTPDGNIKLIDFGIVIFFKTGKKKDTVEMGSLGYAPPEQFGQGQTDVRSDIYSLGVTLHQLLTKRDPAEAENPFDIPLIRTLNPNVSIELERIIQRSTQFEPERRYEKAVELKRDFKILYDEKIRKNSIKETSLQPPTIAINILEENTAGIVQEKDGIIEKEGKESKQSETLIEANRDKKNGLPAEKPQVKLKEKIKKPEKKATENKIPVEKDKEKSDSEEKVRVEEKNKKNIAGKFLIKSVFTLIFLFAFLAAGIYYLYKYPENTPVWLKNYVSFLPSMATPTVTPEEPTAVPTPDLFSLKEDALKKYRENNFLEAGELIKEVLKISPGDPEAMIIGSNIDISINNTDNFTLALMVPSGEGSLAERNAMMKGAFMAVKEINSDWGIRGKMLNIALLEDNPDLNLTVKNLKNIIREKEPVALIGPKDFISELTIAPLLKERDIIHFSPSFSMLSREKDRPFTFGLAPDMKEESKALCNFIYNKLKKEKIGLIYDIQNPYFFELNYIFKEEILSQERNIVEIPVRGDVEDSSEIDRVLSFLDEKKVETIVFFASPGIIKKLIFEIRKKDKGIIFLTGHWGFSEQLLDSSELNGIICIAPLSETLDENFANNYREAFDDNSCVFLTERVYDSIILLKDAIEQEGFRGEDIKEYILIFNKEKPYPGKSGNIYFSGDGEIDPVPGWRILEVINGNFREL